MSIRIEIGNRLIFSQNGYRKAKWVSKEISEEMRLEIVIEMQISRNEGQNGNRKPSYFERRCRNRDWKATCVSHAFHSANQRR